MEKFFIYLGVGVVIVAVIVVLGAICAFPTMVLWNWLMPSIFKLREVNFWEAWGLLVLSGLLLKSTSSSSSSK